MTIRRIAKYAPEDGAGTGGGGTPPSPSASPAPSQPTPSPGTPDASQATPATTAAPQHYPPSPRLGEIIIVRCDDLREARPAIVTKVWSPYSVNAQIFTDGGSDPATPRRNGDVIHRTSLSYSPSLSSSHTWRYQDQ